MSTSYHVVDVFSGDPTRGNPVAVMLGTDEPEETMQAVAAWTGMPETVFVTRPTDRRADYALRIFAPMRELAFAGHPSIGACHLLLELGLVRAANGIVRQQCPAGLFEMRVDPGSATRTIGFTVFADATTELQTTDRIDIGTALAADPSQAFLVEAGARWIVARYEDAAAIAGLRPAFDRVGALADAAGALGISVYGPSPDPDADHEVRSFAPSMGVAEDAVCGGGNACVGAVLARLADQDVVAATVSQGRHLGRHGRVRLVASRQDRSVMVLGEAVTTLSGSIRLPARASGLSLADVSTASSPRTAA